jgi:hypothetical protein
MSKKEKEGDERKEGKKGGRKGGKERKEERERERKGIQERDPMSIRNRLKEYKEGFCRHEQVRPRD